MLIPGKTFLVGEYSVLVGGEALLLATGPGFNVSQVDHNINYHPLSAAGLYARQHHIENHFELHNHFKVGGFGQSTAEFISVWLQKNTKIVRENILSIYDEYRNCYIQNQEMQPSGADLMSQIYGGVTHFAQPIQQSKKVSWPFPQIGFFIFSTGKKAQTHDHLEKLNRDRLHDLVPVSNQVIKYFLDKKQDSFLDGIRDWSSFLEKKQLQELSVLDLKNKIKKSHPAILAVKPNGALGFDTVTVFYDHKQKEEVSEYLNKIAENLGCFFQADETMLLQGVLNNGMD